MSKNSRLLLITIALLLLLTAARTGQAQGSGPPFIIVHGDSDSTSDPPQVHTFISVIDRDSAQTIQGLTTDNFTVQEGRTDVKSPSVSPEPVGLAIVAVIDRGGIAAPRDTRIKNAADLVRELVNRLNVTGGEDDDMIAIVPIAGDEGKENPPVEEWMGDCGPGRDFSYAPVDTNFVLNCLTTMDGKTVQGGTPLYEGLEEALTVLTKNTDAVIRDELTHRRKIIVVFSDGIDPDYSNEAREGDIIREAKDAGISIYAVGMAQQNRQLNQEANLIRLTNQTNGLYQLRNNDETHQQVLDLFDNFMTQRNQYLVTHRTSLPRGDYTLNITVDTPGGSAEAQGAFSSILEASGITLISPQDGLRITVPYSRPIEGFVDQLVEFRVQITSEDTGQYPQEVSYFANNLHIGASNAQPDFPFAWQVSKEMTVTEAIQSQSYTLEARTHDAYLGEEIKSQPVTIHVTWEAKRVTVPEVIVEEGKENWWIILILVALVTGLIVMSFLFRGMRGKLAESPIGRGVTGILKKTQILGPMSPAHGKLVITHGANMGQEFRLAAPLIKIGRDPQFADFVIRDEFVSNPHFSIQMEQTEYFITDDGSSNGTRVNGTPIQPGQRMLLLPEAVIEAGQTRLQFKRLGGPTQQLGAQESSPASPTPMPQPQQQWPQHAPTPPPPPPYGAIQGPTPPGPGQAQRGGPTQIFHDDPNKP